MTTTKKTKHDLPGSIYKNGNRYWWKVQLPGEDSIKARPLKPVGSSMAVTDYNVAVECAKMLIAKAVFASQQNSTDRIQIIADLCKAYMQYANEYYRTGFQTGKEAKQIEYSIKPLIEFYANLPLEQFGPLKLMEIREHMIELCWSRKLINQRVGRLKRMFKWAVSMQYVSPIVYQAINSVEGLKRGRTNAKEGKKVRPADEKHVYMVLGYTTPIVATMVELQLLTGMRPGELVQMKPKDLDRSSAIWHYYPERHKNEYRGHERIVPIGPRGQQILLPYLLRPEDSFFSHQLNLKNNGGKNLQQTERFHFHAGIL